MEEKLETLSVGQWHHLCQYWQGSIGLWSLFLNTYIVSFGYINMVNTTNWYLSGVNMSATINHPNTKKTLHGEIYGFHLMSTNFSPDSMNSNRINLLSTPLPENVQRKRRQVDTFDPETTDSRVPFPRLRNFFKFIRRMISLVTVPIFRFARRLIQPWTRRFIPLRPTTGKTPTPTTSAPPTSTLRTLDVNSTGTQNVTMPQNATTLQNTTATPLNTTTQENTTTVQNTTIPQNTTTIQNTTTRPNRNTTIQNTTTKPSRNTTISKPKVTNRTIVQYEVTETTFEKKLVSGFADGNFHSFDESIIIYESENEPSEQRSFRNVMSIAKSPSSVLDSIEVLASSSEERTFEDKCTLIGEKMSSNISRLNSNENFVTPSSTKSLDAISQLGPQLQFVQFLYSCCPLEGNNVFISWAETKVILNDVVIDPVEGCGNF